MDNLIIGEQSAIPISIGTALAIQSACGLSEEGAVVNDKPPILNYQELLINIRTLFRNYHGSLDKDLRHKVSIDACIDALMADLDIIGQTISKYSLNRIKASLYYCTYNRLTDIYTGAQFKEVSTELQKIYADMENKVIKGLVPRLKAAWGVEVRVYDTRIDGKGSKTLMLTHYPVDLLSYKTFDTLDLLESHTGAIKNRSKWNTKLKGSDKDLERIPFDKMTIQLFGDKGGLMSPYPKKSRDALVSISQKRKWHTLTTKERVILGVQQERIPGLEALVRQLYS